MSRRGITQPIKAHLNTHGVRGIWYFKVYKVSLDVGSYIYTGLVVVFTKGLGMVMVAGSYVLTGLDVTLRSSQIWTNQSKYSSTWTNQDKNSSNWTNQNK